MFQKALVAKPDVGPSLRLNPLRESVRQPRTEPLKARGSAASAALSTEDDFELSSEFIDVFTRASERIAGFVVGCTVIGVVWLAFSIL
jgi:hypothetical protein